MYDERTVVAHVAVLRAVMMWERTIDMRMMRRDWMEGYLRDARCGESRNDYCFPRIV